MSIESIQKPFEKDERSIDFFRERVASRLNTRQDHIADAVGGDEVAKINAILLALEKQGILKES